MDIKHMNPFVDSFMEVMDGLGFAEMRKGNTSVKGNKVTGSGIIMMVGMIGDLKGNVAYIINTEDAKKIASQMMMGMPVDEIDEMARSALSELSNQLTAHAATAFSKIGKAIDISTPTLSHGDNVTITMNASPVLCVQLFADNDLVETYVSFEK